MPPLMWIFPRAPPGCNKHLYLRIEGPKNLPPPALLRSEVDLDFFFGLRGGRSVLPLEDCFGCAFHKNCIAAQDLYFCHIPAREHGEVQANRASNVSVSDDVGVVGFASPDDSPVWSIHTLNLGGGGSNGHEKEQGQAERSERVLECAIGPIAADKICHRRSVLNLGALKGMMTCLSKNRCPKGTHTRLPM